jgi:hypothetical protein
MNASPGDRRSSSWTSPSIESRTSGVWSDNPGFRQRLTLDLPGPSGPCRAKTRTQPPTKMPARQDSPRPGIRVKRKRSRRGRGRGRALLYSRLILARRRARAGDGGRSTVFAQVAEDALGGVRLGDGGDDAHAAVTAGAVERVDEKHPTQKLGPRESVPRGRLRSGRLSGRCRCLPRWNDLCPAGPEREQHGALEDKQSGISRLTQTKEEPFQPVPQENEVEILAALFGQVEKPLAKQTRPDRAIKLRLSDGHRFREDVPFFRA